LPRVARPRPKWSEREADVVAELLLHSRPVPTVFDLLGQNENDMTFALAWGMARSDWFLSAVMRTVTSSAFDPADATINLQQADDAGGLTDIEVGGPNGLHVIFEAKRGWNLPSQEQLTLYERRLVELGSGERKLAVLTQWGAASFLRKHFAAWGLSFPVEIVGWPDLVGITRRAAADGPREDKRLLRELGTYLAGVADMRDIDSNRVYVVALSRQRHPFLPYDFVSIVEDHDRYTYAANGKNWPKVPPNYLGFRYNGRLQSIRHVDDYTVTDDAGTLFPVGSVGSHEPNFVLTLGPPIRPGRPVVTGPGIQQAMRVWADVDLLLTCESITAAMRRSKERRARAEA
jgi:hypothetical protein